MADKASECAGLSRSVEVGGYAARTKGVQLSQLHQPLGFIVLLVQLRQVHPLMGVIALLVQLRQLHPLF